MNFPQTLAVVLAGYIAALLAYFAKNFMFEPLLEFKRVKGNIQNRLKYNSNKYFNGFPPEISRDSFDELRQLSCDLEEKYFAISLKKTFIIARVIPKETILSEVAREMIFISNSPDLDNNKEKREAFYKIKKELHLK